MNLQELTERRRAAARLLIRLSALERHPHVERCIDLDGRFVDWEQLDDWAWSSGEMILIQLFKVIVLGRGDLEVEDLWRLDEYNREVASLALRICLSNQKTTEMVIS